MNQAQVEQIARDLERKAADAKTKANTMRDEAAKEHGRAVVDAHNKRAQAETEATALMLIATEYEATADDLRKAAKIKPKKGAGNGREKDTG